MRTNFQLRDYLNGYKESKLIFSSKYYPEYDHNSVPVPAEYDALRFIFNFYNYNFPFATFFDPSYKTDINPDMEDQVYESLAASAVETVSKVVDIKSVAKKPITVYAA